MPRCFVAERGREFPFIGAARPASPYPPTILVAGPISADTDHGIVGAAEHALADAVDRADAEADFVPILSFT